MIQKVKSDVYLLLLPSVTIFITKKVKTFEVYKINKFHICYLLKANTNLDIKLKIFISNGFLYYKFYK